MADGADPGGARVPASGGTMARKNERSDLVAVMQVMEPQGQPLSRMTICVTGHLSQPREQIHELIVAAGGRVSTKVDYGTTHLVSNADWSAGVLKGEAKSAKYRKAEQFRVKIISEQTLLDMISAGDEAARQSE